MIDESGDAAEARLTAPVSLRSGDGHRVFLAGHAIVVVDGAVAPIVRAGRRYVFSRALPAVWGPGLPASEQLIYVFNEAENLLD